MDSPESQQLYSKVTAQGDVVRKLKQNKATKEEVGAAVKARQHNENINAQLKSDLVIAVIVGTQVVVTS